jgi:hypothetical protein
MRQLEITNCDVKLFVSEALDSSQRASSFEHLLRPRADSEIAGEVAPAHDATAVDQEFGGPRNVVSVHALSFVNEVVPPDGPGVGIREKRKGVAGLLRKIARLLGRVDTDRNRLDAGGAEFSETLFNTP